MACIEKLLPRKSLIFKHINLRFVFKKGNREISQWLQKREESTAVCYQNERAEPSVMLSNFLQLIRTCLHEEKYLCPTSCTAGSGGAGASDIQHGFWVHVWLVWVFF